MFINLMTMTLHIAPNRLIKDLQEDFNQTFPFLKLEFFTNKLSRTDFSAKQIIAPNKKVGESQVVATEGDVLIDEEMKVIDLEKLLREKFSLAVQVFRKSGNLWLETTMTDSWTLQQQNNHGREISTEKKKEIKPEDYDLSRDDNN